MLQKLTGAALLGSAIVSGGAALDRKEPTQPAPSQAVGLDSLSSLSTSSLNPELSRQRLQSSMAKGALVSVNFTPPNVKESADEPQADTKQKTAIDLASPEVRKYLEKLKPDKPESMEGIPAAYLADRGFVRAGARILPNLIGKASPDIQNDLDFLKEVVILKADRYTSYFGGVLEYIKPEHRDNEQFMKGLSEGGLSVYNNASDRLRGKRDFLEFAIKNQSIINLDAVPLPLRHNHDLFAKLSEKATLRVQNGVPLSDLLPDRLLRDKDLWINAANKNSELFRNLPTDMQRDKEFITKAIQRSPYVYKELPEEVKGDREIAQILYRTSPFSLRDLPESLQNDRSFTVDLLRHNGAGFAVLSPAKQRNAALIAAAAETKGGIISLVPAEVFTKNPDLMKELAMRSYNTGEPLQKVVGTLPKEVMDIYLNTERAFKVLGFSEHTYKPQETATGRVGEEQRGRFDATQEVIRNRFEVASPEVQKQLTDLLGKQYFAGIPDATDRRPKIAVILPHADDRGAFSQREEFFSTADFVDEATRENKAIVYEVQTNEEFRDAVAEVKSHGPVEHLIVGAHGASNVMSFGGLDPGEAQVKFGDKRFLTVYDKDIFKDLDGLVVDGGSVLLMSCSTGSVDGAGQNMAQAFHAAMPHTTVYAPTRPTTVVQVVDSVTGLIKSPSFSAGFQHVDSFVAPAQKRVEFSMSGIDPDSARAARRILEGNTYPLNFVEVTAGGKSLVQLSENGELGRKLVRYDSAAQDFVGIEGTELTTQAAKFVVQKKLVNVLTDARTARLWNDWSKTESQAGYVRTDDPLLVDTKARIARELNISPELIAINLSKITGGAYHASIEVREGQTSTQLAKFLATAGNVEGELIVNEEPVVDLKLLGRVLGRRR